MCCWYVGDANLYLNKYCWNVCSASFLISILNIDFSFIKPMRLFFCIVADNYINDNIVSPTEMIPATHNLIMRLYTRRHTPNCTQTHTHLSCNVTSIVCLVALYNSSSSRSCTPPTAVDQPTNKTTTTTLMLRRWRSQQNDFSKIYKWKCSGHAQRHNTRSMLVHIIYIRYTMQAQTPSVCLCVYKWHLIEAMVWHGHSTHTHSHTHTCTHNRKQFS